jgi:16S rRNA (guanine527-N7)-methyltransferase
LSWESLLTLGEVDRVFGDRASTARAYAAILASAGVERGLLGPREAERLWDRHIFNCAAVGELVPSGARVVDVGSGGGLPGVVLALLRPDVRVDLVEPLERRWSFLSEVVAELGLAHAAVHRGRAEDPVVVKEVGGADVVTARAVASLDKLGRWCLPLVRPGGRLLAIKGARAEEELRDCEPALRRAGALSAVVRQCGADFQTAPTTVVEVIRRGTVSVRRSG